MNFEFDPNKSKANKIKHGIDFVEAQTLWLDGGRVTIPAQSFGEPRFAVIARREQMHWLRFSLCGAILFVSYRYVGHAKWRKGTMKIITSAEFDEKFDRSEDISEYLDWNSARRGNDWQFINFALRNEMLHAFDEEASRLGLSHHALATLWIEERLQSLHHSK